MKGLLTISIILLVYSSIYTQSVDWVFLPPGEVSGNCTSNSNYGQSIVCYGLQYTPGFTGIATSYGFGYYIGCTNGNNPFVSESPCIMDNSSFVFPACATDDIVFFQAGGSSSSGISVIEGQPIILHQVCLIISPNDTLVISFDDITGSEVAGELANGTPITDEPFISAVFGLDDSGFGVDECQDTSVCSLTFGTNDNRTVYAINGNGNIVDGTSSSTISSSSFDVYDEVNELCQIEGGVEDVTTKLSLINTYDVYGNGIIDLSAGSMHNIHVDDFGLKGSIPFGVNNNTESSVGDVRGYTVEVTFASHLRVMADQLTLNLLKVNSAGNVFESAAVEFYNLNGSPYGTAIYNGFYGMPPDLSGGCNPTALGTPWSGATQGVYLIDETSTVNISSPCNPVGGTVFQDTILVNARLQAGLDSTAFVGGFKITFLAEDVAVPNVNDDGSGTNGDDGIKGNAPTSTNASVNSGFLGYVVDGCVFQSIPLPVTLVDFAAKQMNDYVQLGWQVAGERNLSHYEVQWSSDNVIFFNLKENVFPYSESNISFGRYNFKHENPIRGRNYYRLKMVDYDQKYEYSTSREVIFQSDKYPELMLWPNPIIQDLFLDFGNELSFNMPIQIINQSGNVLDQFVILEGASSAKIDFTNYEGALFFVRIGADVHKVIKTK